MGMCKLNDIFIFQNGKSITNLLPGTIPVYGSTGIIGYTNKGLYASPNSLIARVGANCGYVQYVNKQCYYVSDNTLIAVAKNNTISKYGYYLLDSLNLNRYHIGAAQPLLTINILNNIPIKLHTIQIQQHIVDTMRTQYDIPIERNM